MEGSVKDILQSGGPMAIHVITVMLFLWFIKAQRATDYEMFKSMHAEHLEARKTTTDALKENASSTKENTVALRSLEIAVKAMPRIQ